MAEPVVAGGGVVGSKAAELYAQVVEDIKKAETARDAIETAPHLAAVWSLLLEKYGSADTVLEFYLQGALSDRANQAVRIEFGSERLMVFLLERLVWRPVSTL